MLIRQIMGIMGCWLCREFKRGCIHVKKKVDEKQEQIDPDCARDLVWWLQASGLGSMDWCPPWNLTGKYLHFFLIVLYNQLHPLQIESQPFQPRLPFRPGLSWAQSESCSLNRFCPCLLPKNLVPAFTFNFRRISAGTVICLLLSYLVITRKKRKAKVNYQVAPLGCTLPAWRKSRLVPPVNVFSVAYL